jgi:hypothetical protein
VELAHHEGSALSHPPQDQDEAGQFPSVFRIRIRTQTKVFFYHKKKNKFVFFNPLQRKIRLHEKPFLGTIVACLYPDPLNNFNPDLRRIRNTDFLIRKQTELLMG